MLPSPEVGFEEISAGFEEISATIPSADVEL